LHLCIVIDRCEELLNTALLSTPQLLLDTELSVIDEGDVRYATMLNGGAERSKRMFVHPN